MNDEARAAMRAAAAALRAEAQSRTALAEQLERLIGDAVLPPGPALLEPPARRRRKARAGQHSKPQPVATRVQAPPPAAPATHGAAESATMDQVVAWLRGEGVEIARFARFVWAIGDARLTSADVLAKANAKRTVRGLAPFVLAQAA